MNRAYYIRLLSNTCLRCITTNFIEPTTGTTSTRKSIRSILYLTARNYGSNSPVSKSSLPAQSKSTSNEYEINQSQKLQKLQSFSNENNQVSVPKRRRKREILRMDEKEYEGYAILTPKLPLLDRRGEAQSHYLRALGPEKRNSADILSILHGDIDLRSASVKRWWSSIKAESEIKLQEYNPKRNSVLGNDLATAHFIVFRKGKIRFRDHNEWVVNYRKDAKPGVAEEDLPVMKFELCTLPTKYDPNYRLEGIDCAGISLRYEGLLNFQNLNYVKWLSFKNAPFIDDWCMDRIVRLFHETLEFIDLSGCSKVTDKGIGTLHRCKKLKTLIVENMEHVKNLEIVSALLEDHAPELSVIGVDYEKKTIELRMEAEELERMAEDEKAKLEALTATIEPKVSPDDPYRISVEK